MNPGAVVALATEILSSFCPKNILRRSRFPRMHLRHGLNAHVNERTASVLDAIAAICVSKSKSDVVAVALKLTLCFVIAANDERRGPTITDHLRTTWGILKNISDLAGHNDKDEVNMDAESPVKKFEESEIMLIYMFYHHIYTFCHAKVIHRFNKQKPILDFLFQMVKKLDADNSYILDIQDLINVTEAITKGLVKCINTYDKAKGIRCVGELLDSQYDIVEKILNWIPLFDNDCEKSIRKIISFHSQVRSLLRCARSRRMRTLFRETHLEIVFVQSNQATLELEPWQCDLACRQILQVNDVHRTDEFILPPKLAPQRTTHCECALISFLENNKNYGPVFGHIGVSKLSCKPCYLWIESLNETKKDIRYETRGCHNKWYKGWRMPYLDQSNMNQIFAANVAHDFCNILMDRGWLREMALSDSTVASEQFSYGHSVGQPRIQENIAWSNEEEKGSRDPDASEGAAEPDGATESHTEINSKLDDSHKAALYETTLGASQDLTDFQRLDEVPGSHGGVEETAQDLSNTGSLDSHENESATERKDGSHNSPRTTPEWANDFFGSIEDIFASPSNDLNDSSASIAEGGAILPPIDKFQGIGGGDKVVLLPPRIGKLGRCFQPNVAQQI